jgi:hypothetical protein
MMISRWLAVALCIVIAAGCAACIPDDPSAGRSHAGVPCEGRPPPTPSTDPSSGEADPSDVVGTPDDIDEIYQVLSTEYADAFAEIKVCDASTLAIYRIPDEGLDEAGLRGRFPDVSLVFFDAELSEAAGQALIDRIEADFELWESRGVHITTMHTELDGRVLVGIRGYVTPEIRDQFVDAYGTSIDVKRRGGGGEL